MRRTWTCLISMACIGVISASELGCSNSNAPKNAQPQSTGSDSAANENSRSGPAKDERGKSSELAAQPDSGSILAGPIGTIEGRVIFVGDDIPQSDVIANTTDPLICGAQNSKRDKEISPTNKGIRYVLVWLDDVKLPDGYKPPRQDLVLDNRNCQFEPHAAVTTVGSVVEAINSDDVFHTTNLYGPVTENMPLVSKGARQKTIVRRSGTIQVKCDKHGWMQAFIRVNPHPFHAVTDADGKFSIANVPAGTYKLKTWHEHFYGQDSEVTAKPDETTTLEIKYPVN